MDEHKAQVSVREVQGVYAIELGAKGSPLAAGGGVFILPPTKTSRWGRNHPTQCTAGLTGGVWPVRPCYSTTTSFLAVWAPLTRPVRPPWGGRSDRPRLGQTTISSV